MTITKKAYKHKPIELNWKAIHESHEWIKDEGAFKFAELVICEMVDHAPEVLSFEYVKTKLNGFIDKAIEEKKNDQT